MATDDKRGLMENTAGDQRISTSVAVLQAELGKLELRLVDRLNEALAAKADKVVQEHHNRELADLSTRMLKMESSALTDEGIVAAQVKQNTSDLAELRNVAKFKKWLWAQTLALAAIAIAIIAVYFQTHTP